LGKWNEKKKNLFLYALAAAGVAGRNLQMRGKRKARAKPSIMHVDHKQRVSHSHSSPASSQLLSLSLSLSLLCIFERVCIPDVHQQLLPQTHDPEDPARRS